MTTAAARIEDRYEALIDALDGNDVAAIEAAGRALEADIADLRAAGSSRLELVQTSQRIAQLADAAARRINILQDRATQRLQTLSALRGQPVAATYTR